VDASTRTPVAVVEALQRAFVAASGRPWFGALAEELLLDGFAAVSVADYARTLEWDRQAHAARYPLPA
jgi:hypothetical protein